MQHPVYCLVGSGALDMRKCHISNMFNMLFDAAYVCFYKHFNECLVKIKTAEDAFDPFDWAICGHYVVHV